MNWTINGMVIAMNVAFAASNIRDGNAIGAALNGGAAGLLAGILLSAWAWGITRAEAEERWNRRPPRN